MRQRRTILSLLSAAFLLAVPLHAQPASAVPLHAQPASAVPLQAQVAAAMPMKVACTITGTAGNDVLIGTAGNDTICGLGGANMIIALGGNDIIVAGDGTGALGNHINPGPGDDVVFGGPGRDQINCAGAATYGYTCTGFGDGRDTAYLGAGNDGGFLGAGDDFADGGPDTDSIRGEGGRDQLYGGGGIGDTLIGGAGNDYLEGHGGGIGLLGGAGNDIMFSITPSLIAPAGATGGAGNDLAVLYDGTIDAFIAEDSPTAGGPILGTPCTISVGGGGASATCPLLPGLSVSIDDRGKVSLSSPLADLANQLKAIWNGTGVVAKDTCYCDTRIPGLSAAIGDTIL